MLVSLQDVGWAATPLNVTLLDCIKAPKNEPVIVTGDGGAPVLGDIDVMTGALPTVKSTPLLVAPVVTVTFPVVAPVGTIAVIKFGPHPEMVAVLLLKT